MARSLKEFEQENTATPSATEVATPSAAGEPVVKDDVVIIGGKERPLKNYEAELKRKHDEELERLKKDYEQKITPPQQPTQQSWYDLVQQRAEQEMMLTGKSVPIQTILEISNSLYEKNLSAFIKTKDSSEKEIRNFKRTIKKDPDFAEIEDDFDTLVEQLKPEQINAPTLEVILNSVRGKKINEIRKQAEEKGRQDALKDTQILGQPVTSTTGGTPPKTSLSAEQQAELDRMNSETTMDWTEQRYMEALVRKQNRFKAAGAKNTPQLLNEAMIK